MIALPFASGKQYAVLGLGKSGRAAIASLLASGAQVTAWDDGEKTRVAISQDFPNVRMVPVSEWNFTEIASLVLSPGIMLNHPAVLAATAHKVEVIGDIELLYRAQPNATYVAITGTNGKSTTTSLIGHILAACGKRVEVGGNLGIPALALAPLGVGEFYVLELSSYQLDSVTSTKFDTAILLNISPDHIDHHGSMDAYIEAKRHIFDRQTAKDFAIFGVDDATSEVICRTMIDAGAAQVLPISVTQKIRHGVDVHNAQLHATIDQEISADISSIRSLQGAHNWQNAAAAYAACRVNGCEHAAIMAAMETYPGLDHRMQWLGEIDGVQFVNDSKATNADAAEKALKTYDNIYWIAGGVAKEGGIESLAPYFPKIRHAYLIGEAAKTFAATLEGHVPYTISETLERAFTTATGDASKATIAAASATPKPASTRSVVLAPACASFDQFANFEVRGAAFMALFAQWKQGELHAATAR